MRDSRTMGQGVVIGQPGAEALLELNKQNYAEQTVFEMVKAFITSTEYRQRFGP